MSVFTESLKQGFKNKKIENLSNEDKKQYRLSTLDIFFKEISNKENRYIFYCPDIVVVNHFVKTIYDIAYCLHTLGYNVTMLHEIKGYKPNWIYQNESTKDYKDLKIDYVIEKREGKKTKKEKNTYGFKPTDTIILMDMFQEILENIYETKLLQKVVLVTGYTGISNLPTGYSYKALGVNTLLFLDSKVKDDYDSVFPDVENKILLDSYQIDKSIFKLEDINTKEIYPVICISKIGNEKLAQQVTNIFYNKYPNFRVFSFKIIARENYEVYIESLKHSCLYLNLDDNLHYQSLLEAIHLGIPTATFYRKEFENDKNLIENLVIADNKDAFTIVEFLIDFCTEWLHTSNVYFQKEVLKIENELKHEDQHTSVNFNKKVKNTFEFLQEERVKFFTNIKQTVEAANEANGSKV